MVSEGICGIAGDSGRSSQSSGGYHLAIVFNFNTTLPISDAESSPDYLSSHSQFSSKSLAKCSQKSIVNSRLSIIAFFKMSIFRLPNQGCAPDRFCTRVGRYPVAPDRGFALGRYSGRYPIPKLIFSGIGYWVLGVLQNWREP